MRRLSQMKCQAGSSNRFPMFVINVVPIVARLGFTAYEVRLKVSAKVVELGI